jgi:hypothetical protein
MYLAVIALTMLLLPVASILIAHALVPTESLTFLVGRWFVFWGVGVRLALAGLRQFFQSAFTSKEIFHVSGDEVLPLVRELGIANLATAAVGLLSLPFPNFVLPVAISACIFYGIAGIRHMAERSRSRNKTIAMASDLFLFVVLAAFLIARWVSS